VHFDPIGDGANGDTLIVGDGIAIASNIAFVTSIGQPPGSFGGLGGADAFCRERAQAGGLPGTYVAWLSASSTNAIDRLTGSRGWSRVDGKPFVDVPADLVAEKIFYPLELDEFGHRVTPFSSVATGTDLNGIITTGYTCSDYSDVAGLIWFGSSGRDTREWTDSGGTNACGAALPVYCFGIGRSTPTMPPPVTTRRAFVLASGWNPGNGLATADSACQMEATAAGLNGMFQALLATTSASAISRFSLAGTTWSRVDGVVLADTPADLAAGRTNVPLDVTAALAHINCYTTWFGAADPTTAGTDAEDCSSWNVNAALNAGIQGDCSETGMYQFDNTPDGMCSQSAPVYCLEL